MSRPRGIPNLRWWIAILLAAATALNYLDRQSFPVAVTEIERHIPISNRQYSELQMLFLLAYAVMYAGGGKIVDWLGTRLGYSVMILGWSIAAAIHGLVDSVMGLGIARLLLGLGEGGGFPCSAKAVAEWFPAEERAFAFGIFNTGSSIGAVVAPPLIALVVLTLNWRWVFYLTGMLGLVWLVCWRIFYQTPDRHKWITDEERDRISPSAVSLDLQNEVPSKPQISWRGLFKYRQTWALLAAKFLTDAAWFFFIFWLPKYLSDERHLDMKHIGYYAWIPYAFAGLGSFAGGWLSGVLIRRYARLGLSRRICLGISAAMMPFSLLIAASPLSIAIGFFSLALFGHQFWSTILQTLAADIFPASVVGSVAGIMGSVGSFGAMLFDLAVGVMVTHFAGYAQVFTIAGILHPLAFLILLILIPRIAPIPMIEQKQAA